MSPLQLHNTRTRAKQTFAPADPSGHVGLFVCRPTVYDLPHLGHAKTYTQFDFLVRLLRRFADADRIRDQLTAHGVILEDSPTGVRSRRSTR
jgi:cysteinyl-tRNA synthetase